MASHVPCVVVHGPVHECSEWFRGKGSKESKIKKIAGPPGNSGGPVFIRMGIKDAATGKGTFRFYT